MKFSAILVLIGTLHVSAGTFSQEQKVKVATKNASLKEILMEIRKQSGIDFIYQDNEISQVNNLSINASDIKVDELLKMCLKGTGLQHQIIDNIIVIKAGNSTLESSFQQDVTIKGKVVDEDGIPIPGVNIILVEYNTGTITNVDGTYEIRIPEGKGTLSFTFIGFEKKVIAVDGQKEVNIQLKTAMSQIDDVVITGYGKRNKESYTGAAVTVSGEELRKVSNDNVLNSLKVLDPSFVMVENNEMGSNPNVVPEFEVRGSASIPGVEDEYTGNPNMPTFILDGFEVSATEVFDMDPYRVKSITLLKDASATAIYGSRGANGVVVIETIAPESGKIQVSYKFGLNVTAPDLKDYDLLNAAEKLQLEKVAGHFEGDGIDDNVDWIEDNIREYNERLKLVQQGVDTYWLSQPVETAVSHNHSLLLEGGDDNFRYGVDVNYNPGKGVMKESGRDRYGMGIKLQYMVDNFTFKNKLTYDNVKSRNSPYGSFSTYALLNPYYRPKDDDGNYRYSLSTEDMSNAVYNPLYNTTLNTVDEAASKRFMNNFSVDWQISQSSLLRGAVSILQEGVGGDNFKPASHTDFANYQGGDISRKGSYVKNNTESSAIEGNLIYTFNKSIGNNLFYVNLAGNIQEQNYEFVSVVAEGFSNPDATSIAFAKQYLQYGRPYAEEYTSRLLGTLGSFNYTYDNRYLVDLTYRFDASSRFGADSRWAPFWSTGLGWNAHNEAFLKQSDLVDRLRVRASYGLTGSQQYNPYQAMITYQYYNSTRYHYGYGAVLKAMGNEKLKWQRTLMANAGFDLDMFSNRLSVSANFYKNLSKDVLTPVTLAPSLGFGSYMDNLGEVENKGVDLRSNVFLIKNTEKRFNWSIGASAVHNVNTLKKISNNLRSVNEKQDEILDKTDEDKDENGDKYVLNRPLIRFIEGESTNSIWAVRSLGIDPATGNEVFLTKDGKKTHIWSSKDMVPVGVKDPDLHGNVSTNFTYKNFQLSMFFMYRIGGQLYNQTLVDRVENADKRYNVDRRVLEERWQKPGDVTFFKRVNDDSSTKPTSRFVEDYSYINLNSVNLSYEFNPKKLERWGLKRLKASFYMNDIFRSSTVRIERGIDYPFARSFSFAIQAKI